MITADRIRELRELEKKATPAEWAGSGRLILEDHVRVNEAKQRSMEIVAEIWRDTDLTLIVAARNALVPLLDEVERLRSEQQEACDLVAKCSTNFSALKADLARVQAERDRMREALSRIVELDSLMDGNTPLNQWHAWQDDAIAKACAALGEGE